MQAFPANVRHHANLPVAVLLSIALLVGCSGSETGGAEPPITGDSTGDAASDTMPAADPANGELEPGTSAPPATTSDEPETLGSPSTGSQGVSARYRLTFDATWSAATHPTRFPPGPHFSGLIGALHSEQVRFWEPGQLATAGIELMAESGGKSDLRAEFQSAIDSGYAQVVLDASGIGSAPDSLAIEFEVSRDYPLLTLVSMLAPSPDWFIGVHGVSLVQDDRFIDRLDVRLTLYDAGTDSGAGFTSANEATVPAEVIAPLTSATGQTDFRDGLPSVGRFLIERL